MMCVINTHIWKTGAKVVTEQSMIPSGTVLKNIVSDLRKRKTVDLKTNSPLPFDTLNIWLLLISLNIEYDFVCFHCIDCY